MALSQQAMEEALWDWFSGALATVASIPAASVFWEDQSIPLPARPCATLSWVSRDDVIGSQARDEKAPVPNTPGVTQTIIHRRMQTVQLDVYSKIPTSPSTSGGRAIAILGNALRLLQTETARNLLAAGGLALRTVSDVRDLTALVETSYETRGSVDLTFSTVDQTNENAGKIVTVTAPVGAFFEG